MRLISQYFHGVSTIRSWFKDGGTTVGFTLAQARTFTCLRCPMNVKQGFWVSLIGRLIKRRMEKMLGRELKTRGMERLHTCSACSCRLPIKVWFPIQDVLPKQADRKNFHESCWVLGES
jgi:hypothetical protein